MPRLNQVSDTLWAGFCTSAGTSHLGVSGGGSYERQRRQYDRRGRGLARLFLLIHVRFQLEASRQWPMRL
jgi:hypothetical protein